MSKLTQKEKQLLASIDAGEWRSVKNLPDEKERYAKIARDTLRNKKVLTSTIKIKNVKRVT